MPADPPKFNKGDVVQRINQPEAVGVVVEVRPESQTASWTYLVQFPGERRSVPETAVRLFVPIETPWEALAKNSVSGRDHFVFTLTYHCNE